MTRFLACLLFSVALALTPAAVSAQDVDAADLPPLSGDAAGAAPPADEAETVEQGRQTLEDILARQRGEGEERQPRDFDSATANAEGIANQLGSLGGASDSEVWEALRFGTADVKVSAGGAPARVVMQDGGMWWTEMRRDVIAPYGGYLLIGTILFLALFFTIRGRIRIDAGKSGIKILRFTSIERFGHWLLAGSFIVLGITGLFSLYARKIWWSGAEEINSVDQIIQRQQGDGFATLLYWNTLVHDNVAWAFMIALVMVFVFWVYHNLPSREDLNWIAKGGGIIGNGHPPARKFNFGQKMIFWSVIILGASISASGISLLFPFEVTLFAKTFAILNELNVPQMLMMDPFPEQLAPHEEMQFAQLWHAIVSFVLMAIILAHIYIGSIGMEGAYAAMGSGKVDLNWAKEHHSLWVENLKKEDDLPPRAEKAVPAE